MVRLVFLILGIAGATQALAREHRFLRIDQPLDGERYADTATIAVNGYLYLPGMKITPEAISVRVSLFRPEGNTFVLQQIGDAKLHMSPREGGGERSFLLDFDWKQRPPAGRYVVRLDCHDRTVAGEPVIATQSVFISIVKSRPTERVTFRAPVEATRPS